MPRWRSLAATDLLALIIVAGEWTGLARAAIGAPVYAAVLDVALVALLLYVAYAAFRTGDARWIRRPPLLVTGLVLYMLLALIEIANPNVPGLLVGLEGYRKTAFTMVGALVVYLAVEGRPSRFFSIVALGSIPALLWAVRQFVAPLPLELGVIESSGVSSTSFHAGIVLRAFAPTAGPFHLGIISAAVVIISVVFAQRDRRWLLLAALAALVLGLTLTRANMLALAVALATVAVVALLHRARPRVVVHAVLVLVIVPATAFVASGARASGPSPSASPSSVASGASAAPSAQWTPVPPTVDEVVSGIADPLEDANLQHRLRFWGQFVRAIAERPVIGYGTSSAADGFARLYAGTGSVRFQPHSMYFKAALELGVGGLVLLLAIFVAIGVGAVQYARRSLDIGLIVGGLATLTLVSGLTGPMLDGYPFNLLLWSAAGWLMGTTGQPSAAEPAR